MQLALSTYAVSGSPDTVDPGCEKGSLFTKDGLPLSMQIAGRPFDDARVLRAGHAYEMAAGWLKQKPKQPKKKLKKLRN